MVVAQVAFSVVLITGAGPFLRTLHELWNVNIGYDRENVLMFSSQAAEPGPFIGRSCEGCRPFPA